MKMKTLEIQALADPGNLVFLGYYTDPTTGDRYALYTDSSTGVRYWYRYTVTGLGYGQYIYALATVPAPKTIEVMRGETVRVYVTFYYLGDVFNGYLHVGASMGAPLWTEAFKSDIPLSLSKCTTSTPFTTKYADMVVASDAPAGSYYIYAKITDGVSLELGKTLTPWYENALSVVGVEPKFTEFAIDFEKTAKV